MAKLLVCPGGRGSTSVIWLPTDPMSADNRPMSATQSVQVARLQTRQKVSSAFDHASIKNSKWPQSGGLRSVCSAVDPSLSDAELRVAGECRLIVCYQGDHGKDRGLIVREISGQETERV